MLFNKNIHIFVLLQLFILPYFTISASDEMPARRDDEVLSSPLPHKVNVSDKEFGERELEVTTAQDSYLPFNARWLFEDVLFTEDSTFQAAPLRDLWGDIFGNFSEGTLSRTMNVSRGFYVISYRQLTKLLLKDFSLRIKKLHNSEFPGLDLSAPPLKFSITSKSGLWGYYNGTITFKYVEPTGDFNKLKHRFLEWKKQTAPIGGIHPVYSLLSDPFTTTWLNAFRDALEKSHYCTLYAPNGLGDEFKSYFGSSLQNAGNCLG